MVTLLQRADLALPNYSELELEGSSYTRKPIIIRAQKKKREIYTFVFNFQRFMKKTTSASDNQNVSQFLSKAGEKRIAIEKELWAQIREEAKPAAGFLIDVSGLLFKVQEIIDPMMVLMLQNLQ
ncbi:hypothetical protein L3Y34_012954 [Caenorhabditis briggsae]|uniref:Uncharacterized protein n=1 Tax=Caenorhabditis briggsae TaxID=6238 RepID=A0AAE9CX30_CAEBR|nr:hypothetical protein L3Y34_012954 [Caenorhabditis briggsae]